MSSKFVGGIKHETVVGAELKVNLINKSEYIKGVHIKLGKAREIKTFPEALEYYKSSRNTVALIDAIKADKIEVTAKEQKQKHDQLIMDVVNAVQFNFQKLDAKIDAAYQMTVGLLHIKSDGDILLNAADSIVLDGIETIVSHKFSADGGALKVGY